MNANEYKKGEQIVPADSKQPPGGMASDNRGVFR